MLALAGLTLAGRLPLAAKAGNAAQQEAVTPLHTVRSGDLVITLSTSEGQITQGKNTVTIEFRSAMTGQLVDVGSVKSGAAMTMPGMTITGGVEIERGNEPGRYVATASYAMAATWQMTLEWNGPAGRGSTSFEVDVQ